MTLLTLENVARKFGDYVVFDDVDLRIDERDRIGVVGDNGSGKTTLIEVLAGIDEPDAGRRHSKRGLRIAYAAQIPALEPGTTVRDWVQRGDGSFARLEAQVRALEHELAERPDDAPLLEQYGSLQNAYQAGGGYERPHLCEKVLSGIGFAPGDGDKDVAVLSGGEQTRVQLCALMTAPADLLVLDEPTNHLDLDGIEFLESYLSRYRGAYVVVSHDRRFLDRVATSIVEVDDGTVRRYPGNYAAYRGQRDARLLAEARAHRDQQQHIEKEMEYIRRNMAGRMSAQAKGRLKRLQRLERLEAPGATRTGMRLRLRGGRGLAGQSVLEAHDVGYALPGGRVLLRGATFRLLYGETLGILGRNGAGKTTLLRLLAGTLRPQHGRIERAPRVQPGYFSQDMADLPTGGTVLAALRALDAQATEKELRDHLALFLFFGDDVDQRVETLSGGEQRRLSLARLTWSDFDYLCLDEPTNHLDITARENLERALRDYPGGAVVISHDREFLDAVTDRVLWLEDGHVTVYDGGLASCLERRAVEAREAKGAAPSRRDDPPEPQASRAQPAPEPAAGKIRNPLLFAKLEDKIIALEERLETLRAEMASADNYLEPDRMRALLAQEQELQRELDEANARWESWT